ncbi:MAG TPA: 3-deoxy-D-manno-octulosonic acid transferase [Xanthobacteraceae bacterium]|nr:3-deoxy-D-manno-octulosonic acid transferase [Xanthobacteraceae bacterium]
MADRPPLSLKAYRMASRLAMPALPRVLSRRLARGKEEAGRLQERYGIASRPRPAGPLVWFHTASVGELMAVLPLVERICDQGFAVLCTSGTVTSAALAQERLPEGAIHQYVPLDVPRYVRRFLAHWQPDLALFVESDLWPNLITATAARRVPMLVVNGRLSERSFRTWRRAPKTIGALLSHVDLCLAQSPAHAQRYSDLGAPRITTTGNLKLDGPSQPADESKLRALRFAIGSRPVIAAASTHPGEEDIVVAVHRELRARHPQLLTIIAPRHPERGDAVSAVAATAGLQVTLRSRGGIPGPRTDIYVADTLGELGLLYRLAPVVFVGGSLVPHGGQNPVEPVKLGAAVLHGPHVANFQEIYDELDQAGGAVQVTDGAGLAARMDAWLGAPAARRQATAAAQATVERLGGAFGRTLAAIEPYLLQLRLQGRHGAGNGGRNDHG